MYLIEILHQTTTPRERPKEAAALYLIEILHQTTTKPISQECVWRCILSKFYIKPQLLAPFLIRSCVVSYRNSTSNHNFSASGVIEVIVVSYRNSTSNHNFCLTLLALRIVVSYRNSTSNHNFRLPLYPVGRLYLIEILHQTTTIDAFRPRFSPLYLIEILHQTTTSTCARSFGYSCILSKFYIKPQLSTNQGRER